MQEGAGNAQVGAPPADPGLTSSFTYHPADPTPTIGGRLLSAEGGYREDSALATRADVLNTRPLDELLGRTG